VNPNRVSGSPKNPSAFALFQHTQPDVTGFSQRTDKENEKKQVLKKDF
jgi:hypothetical protein